MHSLSADNRHIGRYIVQSADYRIYADYLQYRIGRISVSANFPNLDIVCTLIIIMCPMAFVVILLYFMYDILMEPQRLPLLN